MSFYPSKNIGAVGDGGAIITNSKSIFNYCKRAKDHGALKKYDHQFSGRNSRLDTIQSAVLNIKLKILRYAGTISKENCVSPLNLSI